VLLGFVSSQSLFGDENPELIENGVLSVSLMGSPSCEKDEVIHKQLI